MRRSCALGALCLLAACDSSSVDADFTGITLRTSFPEAWGVTELHTYGSLDDGSPAFPMGVTPVTEPAVDGQILETLAIILEADKSGERVALEVEGRDATGAVVGAGEDAVRLMLGYFITSTVTLTADVLCSNGVRDEGEACDDGNRFEGDGCSPSCEIEPDFVCVGAPSRCTAAASTALVDPAAPSCPGNGTAAAPFCRIARALDAPWATTLALAPGTYDEAVTISRAVTIHAEAEAELDTDDTPALRIEADEVIVRGLTVRGASRIGGGVLVAGATGRVTLEEMTVGPSSTVGVSVIGDVLLELDRTRIIRNAGGGLRLDSSRGYVVHNTFVTDNGDGQADFGGVYFAQSPTNSVFANNTVADNEASDPAAGGVWCETPARVLNSIVWNNGTVTASVTCNFDYSDVGPLDAGLTLDDGSFSEDPGLSHSFRISAGSSCIDRGDPDSIANDEAPDHDFDGEPRPQGPNIDVGADEAG